ncbi:tryptophan 2,3-dioxygenase family protein [Streptomyces sp. HUAS MG91]|uniref:Tryptophan 2,3-dioxygenase family protein n=1 Tax=Streptomyces tabacisoli TaxID=3156398 RepID=A0AAU8IKL0_9ACTN
MELRETSPENKLAAERWMNEYLTREHSELGRRGPVCPFVGPAHEAGTIYTQTLHASHEDTADELVEGLRDQLDHFAGLLVPEGRESLAALVTVVEGLPEHRWRLLDAAQARLRQEAARRGLMIGQFHPNCPEPAFWRPSFAVSRSPIPLVAIRYMAFHDILFLHSDPSLFEEYRKRFGDRYNGERKVSDAFRKLYDSAPRLPVESGQPYIDYQSITLLHALHQPRTDQPAESSFYLAGQSKELLFALVLGEMRACQEAMAADDLGRSTWHLRRGTAGMRLLSEFWDLLSTLSPAEFHSFRDALGEASGLGSYKYRTLEFTLGLSSPSMAQAYRGVPAAEIEVHRALHDASVYDDALAVLVRLGRLEQAAIDPERDTQAVRAAWAAIHQGETVSSEILRWAESLMDLAQAFGRWRLLHLLTVERVIGSKPGTGGTAGVDWLRRVANERAFPELWEARSALAGGPPHVGCPAARVPFAQP